jgi:hypothetical protein
MKHCIPLFLLLAGASRAQEACGPSTSAVIELGMHSFVQDTFPKDRNDTVYQAAVPPEEVRWVRTQVRMDKAGDGNWRLDVRDAQFRLIDSLVGPDFSPGNVRWTPRIYTAGLYLDLRGAQAQGQPAFTILQYITMLNSKQPTYYSYKKAVPDWKYTDSLNVDSDNLPRLRMADAAGLFFSNVPGLGGWSCSGVLVAADLFLTNHHCGGPTGTGDEDLWSREIIQDSFVDLSWDGDQVSRELRVIKVEASSKPLDYALLKVEPLDRGPLPEPATIRTNPTERNVAIELVHHPAAAKKAISSCVVAQPDYPGWQNAAIPSEIAYDCDTDEGSSGAPVFAGGELAAMHHLGYSRGPDCKPDHMNKAVKITEIVTSLPDTLRRRLRIGTPKN